MNIEDIQKLINEDPEIKRPKDFKDKYPKLYQSSKNKGYLSKLVYESRRIKKRLDTLEDLQKLINGDDRVNSPSDLQKYHYGEYQYAQRKGYLSKLVYNTRITNLEYSLEEVQGVIKSNNIGSPTELLKTYPKIYRLAARNKWLKKLIYKEEKEYSLEEIQNIIDNDPEVTMRKDFIRKYKNEYKYSKTHNFYKDLVFDIDKPKFTLEEIQEIIDTNENINSPGDLKKLYPSVYGLSKKYKYIKDLKFKHRIEKFTMSLDEIQEIIDSDLEINRSTDLKIKYPNIFNYLGHHKLFDKINFRARYGYSGPLTLEEFNNFIKENDIKSPVDLATRFRRIYFKAHNLKFLSKLEYTNRKDYLSYITIEVIEMLESNNISYELEVTFDWLKDINNMFYDIYLPKYNIAIECHGLQHFVRCTRFDKTEEDFYNRQKRDYLKYQLSNENNIKILYYVNPNLYKYRYNKCKDKVENYFSKIYLTLDDLLAAIKFLINENG